MTKRDFESHLRGYNAKNILEAYIDTITETKRVQRSKEVNEVIDANIRNLELSMYVILKSIENEKRLEVSGGFD
jgi:hypothetical protein